MKRQRGYVDLSGLDFVFFTAVVGLLSLIAGGAFGLVWLIAHVRFV